MGGALEDTICAIATPVGEGGIGIVRVSGAQAIAIASRLVRLKSGRSLHSVRSHTLYRADLVSLQGSSAGPDGRPLAAGSGGAHSSLIDEALVVVMRRPRSFTAEDVVEFHCHGGLLVLQALCEALVAAGARLAEPGEFTRRAFLNGRLDLAQAEAVLDTIRAKTAAGLKLAQRVALLPANQLHMMKLLINQAYEQMGLHVTQMIGTLLDGIARHTPEGVDFTRRAMEDARRAVAERDAPFGDYGQERREQRADQ